MAKEHCELARQNKRNQAECDRTRLRAKIVRSLRAQGFCVKKGNVVPPANLTKDDVRSLHSVAVKHQKDRSRPRLEHLESTLLRRIASGCEIDPVKISPSLIEVQSDSEDELLFRYAGLHWSIPVSSGYGRRLRFLVIDDQNGKLIGLIGLGDPVFSLGARDRWIGWSPGARSTRLKNVMDAFVLGAIPPYSFLRCGKLVAMLATSETIRRSFKRKYAGTRSLIRKQPHDGRLALITTTSALGRSSLYNRIRLGAVPLYTSVGYTMGSGEFHFTNGLYSTISDYADKHCTATAKQETWGTGFRNRREVVKKVLPALGLRSEWLYHGIEREVFVVPMAHNSREFLCEEHSRVRWFHRTTDDIISYFKERWLMPRIAKDNSYLTWNSSQWRLWTKG